MVVGLKEVKNHVVRILKPDGYSISFGWNSIGVGKTRGLIKEEVVLVCHGGQHYDTIAVVERRGPTSPQ